MKIYCGQGKGKSNAALGRALVCASEGKKVFVVQFLKGKLTGQLDFFSRLEPDLKIFRFEKEVGFYENLSPSAKEEEKQNIFNGLNFVRKVLSIGECDVLILDEILGLVDLDIIQEEDILQLINLTSPPMELILTGRQLPEQFANQADYISEINIIKDKMSGDS